MSDEKLKKRNEITDSKENSSQKNENESQDENEDDSKKENETENENISQKSSSNLSPNEKPEVVESGVQNQEQSMESEISPTKEIFQKNIVDQLAEEKETEQREEGEKKESSVVPPLPHTTSLFLNEEKKPRDKSEGEKISKKRDSEDSMNASTYIIPTVGTGKVFAYMVLPPDGGYGWFVVFISFLTQLIIDGIVFSIGIILPFIAEDLKVGQSEIIFVSALQVFFYYLSGPISSAIINKFGFRKVAITGAAGSIICFIIASYSPNLEMLIIFYSCLGGPMLSMVWVSSQLIVGYYFEKYRSIAVGLACAGSGVGFFTFANLNALLIPKIGWRYNAHIHASLIFVALLLNFAFIEVPPSKIGILRERKDMEDTLSSADEFEIANFAYTDAMRIKPEDRSYAEMEIVTITEEQINKSRKLKCCKCCHCCKRKIYKTTEEGSDAIKRYMIQKDLFDKHDIFYTGPPEYLENDKTQSREIISGIDVELVTDEKMVASVNYMLSVNALHKKDSKEMKEKHCFVCVKLSKKIPKKIKTAFQQLFNFQLFRVLEFRILFFSAFCFSLGINTPFLFSKARLVLPTNQQNLVPIIIGVSNCISRILSGFIAFKLRPYIAYLCGGAVTIGGLMIFVSAFYGTDIFWFQLMYAVLFGMAPGFFSSLRAIIYVKYLGLKNLTNAFGLIAMGMGTGIFTGTVVSGYVNDISGSYMVSFIFSGTCISIAGLMKLLLPTILRKMQKMPSA